MWQNPWLKDIFIKMKMVMKECHQLTTTSIGSLGWATHQALQISNPNDNKGGWLIASQQTCTSNTATNSKGIQNCRSQPVPVCFTKS